MILTVRKKRGRRATCGAMARSRAPDLAGTRHARYRVTHFSLAALVNWTHTFATVQMHGHNVRRFRCCRYDTDSARARACHLSIAPIHTRERRDTTASTKSKRSQLIELVAPHGLNAPGSVIFCTARMALVCASNAIGSRSSG